MFVFLVETDPESETTELVVTRVDNAELAAAQAREGDVEIRLLRVIVFPWYQASAYEARRASGRLHGRHA
jgi:hypothetical protein